MRKVQPIAAYLSLLNLIGPASAWNGTGHRAVAFIAYSNLTAKARERVNKMLEMHPDIDLLVEDASDDPVERARHIFVTAATWPDKIKSDDRFFEDGSAPDDVDVLAGFPDMDRHRNWHFIDNAFSPDGVNLTSFTPVPPTALSQINAFRKQIGNSRTDAAVQVFQLPWLLHLIGDVHQPLHCTTRVLKTQIDRRTHLPTGDRGGNKVVVRGSGNLHSFWDDCLGRSETDEFVAKLATFIMDSNPKPATLDLDTQQWIDESFKIGKAVVYDFGPGGTKDAPAVLSDAYKLNAKKIARDRVAQAGYRLAAVLNELLN